MNAHWTVKRLGEIFEIARGGSPRPIEKFLTNDSTGLNWIKIGDATASGKFIKVTKEKIKPEGLSKSRFVSSGDFLLTNSMSFGRPYIMATDGCIHDGWLVLKPHDRKLVDQDYFYHLLGSNTIYEMLSARASGSTVKNLNTEIVSSVEIKLPPLDEQRLAELVDVSRQLVRVRKHCQTLTEAVDPLCGRTFGVALEQLEEFLLPRHQRTEPAQHGTTPRSRDAATPRNPVAPLVHPAERFGRKGRSGDNSRVLRARPAR